MIKQLKINKMKRTIVLLLLYILALNATAQVEIIELKPKTVSKIGKLQAIPYDSMTNITPQKHGGSDNYKLTLHHLIGQTLLYCGDPYYHSSKHSFIKGAYYRVDDILPDDQRKGLYHRLLLTNLNTGAQTKEGDIFTDTYNYKWVVVGHYEKIKSMYINKDFVYVGYEGTLIGFDGIEDTWNTDYVLDKANGLIDLNSETVTTHIPAGSVWTCVDVQIKPREKNDRMDIDKRSPIVLVFDNPDYGKHYCYLEDKTGKPYKALFDENEPLICGRFQLKPYYDEQRAIAAANYEKRKAELTKKYGAKNANLILERKVKIGWTKEMCEESWGSPSHVNRTINSQGTHEQWVYRNSYLYFDGNKLTTIQDND